MRVHIRDAKGNKDRFVPLSKTTLTVIRRFWSVHRNPVLLFPNRKGGLKGSATATTPLDRSGVQITMGKVVENCGIKKMTCRDALMQRLQDAKELYSALSSAQLCHAPA